MKEAMRMVTESIYDPEFPDTSHFHLGQGCHSRLTTPSSFTQPTQKKFYAGRLVGGEKGPDSIPNSVLLSALQGNIYLHKIDQDIGRIRQKHEIPLEDRYGKKQASSLLKTTPPS
ncbi:hypothetical protein ZWY2020_045267 [Hordeum vulgare]|nr:hypothetical protein ZWY2020_045267 [Hordeum vulgare]